MVSRTATRARPAVIPDSGTSGTVPVKRLWRVPLWFGGQGFYLCESRDDRTYFLDKERGPDLALEISDTNADFLVEENTWPRAVATTPTLREL